MTTKNIKSIEVGVSSCLMGNHVRYNGGHKHSELVTSLELEGFDMLPICPEVEAGLPVPRPPIRLMGNPKEQKVVYVHDTSKEVTPLLIDYADKKIETLQSLSGFILKKDSPSCGLERVKVYSEAGIPTRTGTGVFASKLISEYPLMPLEEEGRLNNPALRDNFIECVRVYSAWQALQRSGANVPSLIDFHRAHKMIILSHNEKIYRELGRLVAQSRISNIHAISHQYVTGLMTALKTLPTRGRHVNVLFHIASYLKRHLAKPDRNELQELIKSFHDGHVSLFVPISLIRHHLRINPVEYIGEQLYLSMRFAKLQTL